MPFRQFRTHHFVTFIAAFLFFPTCLLAQSITLSDKQEIELGLALHSKIREIGAKVADCMKPGTKTLKDCQCAAQQNLFQLKELYDSALKRYPHWAENTLNMMNGPASIAVNLNAIKNLSEMTPCN